MKIYYSHPFCISGNDIFLRLKIPKTYFPLLFLSLSSEGGSELHQHVRREVQLWGWLWMLWVGHSPKALQILQQDPGNNW